MPSPSIIPEDLDRDVYIVLEDFGDLGRAWRETDEAKADRATLLQYLREGQYEHPVRIVAFSTTQGWCRDVTDEIAAEVRGLCAGEVSPSLAAFLEAH